MERLKAILADKILDISSASGDEVKVKIDKMQRFRDFANACQTLMKRYPTIEDELIKMVEAGDFDTKVASSRVDTVIRLADNEEVQSNRVIIPQITDPLITEESEVIDLPAEEDAESYIPFEDVYQSEVVDQIINSDEEAETTSEHIFKSVQEDTNSEIYEEEEADAPLSEEELAARRKVIIKRAVQVAGLVAIVVAFIFIVKFVMLHWQTILIIIGVLAILAILFFWFKRKR